MVRIPRDLLALGVIVVLVVYGVYSYLKLRELGDYIKSVNTKYDDLKAECQGFETDSSVVVAELKEKNSELNRYYTGVDALRNLCEELGVPNKDRCYYSIAVLNKDESLCEKAQFLTWRDSCYNSLAKVKGTSLCEKIGDPVGRENCLKGVESPA